MRYDEGVALVKQVIADLRGEVARDEAQAQELWDQAALRTAFLDQISETLDGLTTPIDAGACWAVMPGKPCAAKRAQAAGGCAVPTKEAAQSEP